MIFHKYKNIDINDEIGVSPIGKDTLLIAKHAKKIKSNNALDVGTGTGFIPIYLNKCGLHCDGIDISPLVIKCASDNARKNNCEINFFTSDLFQNVSKQYDLLIFNPPFGNTNSETLSKYLEIIKSLFPKENRVISNASYFFIKKNRVKLILRFFDQFKKNFQKNGKILLFLHKSELKIIQKFSYEILDEYDSMKLVLIYFN